MDSNVIKTEYGNINIIFSNELNNKDIYICDLNKIFDKYLSIKEKGKYCVKIINIGDNDGFK